ncbi:MAG: GxxExxY protein [Mariniblastus sp.]
MLVEAWRCIFAERSRLLYDVNRRIPECLNRFQLPSGELKMNENEISKLIVSASIEVHRTLGGPGLLESVYEEALAYELKQVGCGVQRQAQSPIRYKNVTLSTPLKIDLLVNEMVIVECKAVAQYNAIFATQVLTYLRLRDLKLGLVINFGEKLVKDGIHRVVNGL